MIATVSNLTNNPADMRSKVVIEKEMLLQFEFTGLAKEFVNKIDKELDIQLSSKDYYKLVLNFYRWFHIRQLEIDKDDFKELDIIRQEINNLLFII